MNISPNTKNDKWESKPGNPPHLVMKKKSLPIKVPGVRSKIPLQNVHVIYNIYTEVARP